MDNEFAGAGWVVCLQTISSGAGLIGTVIEAGEGRRRSICRIATFRVFGFGGRFLGRLCGGR